MIVKNRKAKQQQVERTLIYTGARILLVLTYVYVKETKRYKLS